MMELRPFQPMSPIAADRLPAGPAWTFQLKWDGYRLVAAVDGGEARLLTKHMHAANALFPEIAEACARLPGRLLLDGEAVVMDPATGRPSFQKLQQRGKLRDAARILQAAQRLPVQYIVFDVLRIGDEDLRPLSYAERDRRLRELAAGWTAPLFTTDRFADGAALWDWVARSGWEGVVAKRLAAPYREGKAHRDWWKKKRKPEYDVEIVGILWREGRVASLVMREGGVYFGRVSAGLDGALKQRLSLLGVPDPGRCPLPQMPQSLRKEDIRWLDAPIGARVTGTEVTEDGVLRHPKLLMLDV